MTDYHIPLNPEHKSFLENCYHVHPKCWSYKTPEESSCPIAAACLDTNREDGESDVDFCIRWETAVRDAIDKYLQSAH